MSEDEYSRLLNQFPEKFYGALNWKIYLNRLIQAGRKTGRTDIKIGDDIRNTLKGQLDDRTVRAYLPSSMKHMEKKNLSLELKAKYADLDPHPKTQRKSKYEDLDPHPHIVEIEPEPEPQREPPKLKDKQTFTLDRHTCKGWPDDKLEKYEIVCQGGKVIRVIML